MAFFTNFIAELFDGDEDEESREAENARQYHRFESFSPVRHNAQVKYFIDGRDYCWAVSEAIERAQKCIFIEDWWLSPELYLRRPPEKYPEYRIDALLKRKAEEGVKVFVVVYKEVSFALTNDSEHTKEHLESLHENIVVQRSPDFSLNGRDAFWSHHEKICVVDNSIAFLGGLDLCYGRWDTHAHPLVDFSSEGNYELIPGQDYNNARVQDFKDVRQWDLRLINKSVTPRMPWHDVSLCIRGAPVLDVSRHFCERWNYIKHKKAMDDSSVLFLRPPLGAFGGHQQFSLPGDDDEYEAHQSFRFPHGTRNVDGTCRVQVLRSVGDWSLGVEKTEHSIQNAYISAIHDAEHFVYIENQFFITATEDDEDYVLKNQIGQAIVRRIIRAAEEQTPFKVIVLMPLMPAFPADLSTDAAATARMVMSYQYESICRGGRSIIEKLTEAGVDANEYIRFFSLRNHGRMNRQKIEEIMAQQAGYSALEADIEEEVDYARVSAYGEESATNSEFVSEELYIHAKLLIADDKVVIMGSANLNDRSQCGDRDSEIAVIVEDQDKIPSQMNGEYYEAGRFAATLRRQLWKEHLGLINDTGIDDVNEDMMPLPVPQIDYTETEEDRLVMDPLSEETLNLWYDTARTNTEAFRAVFHCVPDDTVTNWDEYKEFYPSGEDIDIGHVYNPDMGVDEITENLSRIRGHLVEFPLNFLKEVNLQGDAIPIISDFTAELYT